MLTRSLAGVQSRLRCCHRAILGGRCALSHNVSTVGKENIPHHSLLNCIDGLPLVYDGVISKECRATMISPDIFDFGPDTYRRQDGAAHHRNS